MHDMSTHLPHVYGHTAITMLDDEYLPPPLVHQPPDMSVKLLLLLLLLLLLILQRILLLLLLLLLLRDYSRLAHTTRIGNSVSINLWHDRGTVYFVFHQNNGWTGEATST